MREHLHVFDRRRWKDAVPEIEDVAGTVPDSPEHRIGLLHHACGRAKQQCRIEIALHCMCRTDP